MLKIIHSIYPEEKSHFKNPKKAKKYLFFQKLRKEVEFNEKISNQMDKVLAKSNQDAKCSYSECILFVATAIAIMIFMICTIVAVLRDATSKNPSSDSNIIPVFSFLAAFSLCLTCCVLRICWYKKVEEIYERQKEIINKEKLELDQSKTKLEEFKPELGELIQEPQSKSENSISH